MKLNRIFLGDIQKGLQPSEDQHLIRKIGNINLSMSCLEDEKVIWEDLDYHLLVYQGSLKILDEQQEKILKTGEYCKIEGNCCTYIYPIETTYLILANKEKQA